MFNYRKYEAYPSSRFFDVDYSRFDTLLDKRILHEAKVSFAGVGGSANLIRTLAQMGVGEFNLVDFDKVDAANIPTQGYGVHQIGINKAEAVAADVGQLNTGVRVNVHKCRIEDLSADAKQAFIDADLLMGVTDSIDANGLVNQWAVEHRRDALFGGCYPGCVGTEITGTFPDMIDAGVGCHRCFTDPRYRFRKEHPDTAEAPFYNRHILIGDLLNVQLGYLGISLLHLRAGSELSIIKLAARFMRDPLLMTRIASDFYAAPGEMFSDLADGYGALVSRHWHKDVPGDFICPDCGTPGH